MRNRKHDIEKYLRGELSAAEMHALEKEALSDPFLAEALEGIEQAGADNFLYDLHKINRSVHDRMRKRSRKNNKTIRMWGWTSAVAATILLLAVSGFLVVQILKDHGSRSSQASDRSSAQAEPENPMADSLPVKSNDSSLMALQEPEALGSETSPDKRTEQPQQVEKTETEIKSSPSRPQVSGEQKRRAEGEVQRETLAQPPAEAEVRHDITAAETEPVDSLRSTGPASEKTKQALEGRVAGIQTEKPTGAAMRSMGPVKVVKGQVRSEDGHGLPGVNVMIEGTSTATVTDAEGYYSIATPEDARLVFSFIGFDSQVVAAETPQVNVTLEEDISALSEVVVTGYSTRPGDAADASFHSAEPTVGQTDFKNYLASAVKYPQEAIRNKIEGKVTVRFTVEPSGQLSDFEVIKGIGSGCEEELIRAIQEGPYWKPGKRGDQPIKDKVRVRFKFNLPE